MPFMHINNVPMHKRISSYLIDYFKGEVEGCTHYFLTHFHADHYYGLKRTFPHTIYCSTTTSNLLRLKYKAKTEALEMYKEYELNEGETVRLIDAHHCPGAVCLIFKIQGEYILHTGDFRSTPAFLHQMSGYTSRMDTSSSMDITLTDITSTEITCRDITSSDTGIHTVYLDNTYEGFRPFGSQREAIHRVLRVIQECLTRPCVIPLRYTFMFCTYAIGKEKIFLSAAEYFGRSVRVSKEKKRIYDCYDQYTVDKLNKEVLEILGKSESTNGPFSRITDEEDVDQFIVISTMQKDYNSLLKGCPTDRVVVFSGSGWKDCVKYYDLLKKNRVVKKGIEVHHIPYSEHSSSEELKIFKETIRPTRVVNTVKNLEENENNYL